MLIADVKVGQRVKLHPATDLWMQGCRYGEVARVGGRWAYVRLDANGLTKKIAPENLEPVPTWHRLGTDERGRMTQ